MRNKNWLADLFNTLGEIFEKFNPAAFRFLAAVLPYLTPLPVAAISQANATKFLNLNPTISGVLVFGLEGIGLWFTSLFVDAVVEAIRSKNGKAWLNVLMFAVAVTVYVVILININVIIEQSSGNVDPAYSRVITLLCFLPLITGIGNGYYKLKLEQKTNTELAQERQIEQQNRVMEDNHRLKVEKALIKAGINPLAQPVVTLNQDVPVVKEEQRERKASEYKDKIWELLNDVYDNGKTMRFSKGTVKLPVGSILKVAQIVEHFGLNYDKAKGFVSTQRTLWAQSRGLVGNNKGSTS